MRSMRTRASSRRGLLGYSILSLGSACTSPSTSDPTMADAGKPDNHASTITLSYEPQRPGDPARGHRALLNEPYVPCGIPWSAYSRVFAPAPADQRVVGREGRNASLAYNFTAMTTKDGVELVTSNCLTCHAGRIDGALVVGLGAADGDFTRTAAEQLVVAESAGLLLSDPKEIAEWKKWKSRIEVVAPHSALSTRGPNPADNFTAALFAHHDPKTLAWSDNPLIPVPPPHDTPVDVPPLWRMKKKSSMFYVGAGRGDHARIMMTASILCTSSVEESRAIDSYFADIRAYIASIEPPKFPWPIDRPLADRGRTVFEATCSRCHGTYGPGESYPNRLLPIAEIGTDPVLASGTAQFATPFAGWFKSSFFGELSRLEPQAAYVAPPLDGIWATAPFLHNGSVPTIEALLDSSKRPTYWTRSFDSAAYDAAALGWKHTALAHGKSGERNENARKSIYDTTLPGYGNGGHLFGDALLPDDRAAIIEYLKTL